MTGSLSINSKWGPWGGGGDCTFERSDIVAIGKMRTTGDNKIKLVVRLADGREVFVNASKQPADDCDWLYKTGKELEAARESINWKDVTP